MNISTKDIAEQLWNSNTFELSCYAKPQDLSIFQVTEYFRQLYLILLVELSKEKYTNYIPVKTGVKNLTYLVHQNLLLFVDYIHNNDIHKLENDAKVKKMLFTSLNVRLKVGEHVSVLKQNNEGIVSNLKTLSR